MKLRVALLAACIGIAACQQQNSTEPQASAPEPGTATTSAAAAPAEAPVTQDYVAPPDGFKKALPAGVIIKQRYKARMDVLVPNRDGSQGRRTEFAFTEGDAKQAMRHFADALAAAGFTVAEGPVEEAGVTRQVFKKPGYGLVFARAENSNAETMKDPEAKGFLVAAWPSDTANDSSTRADGG